LFTNEFPNGLDVDFAVVAADLVGGKGVEDAFENGEATAVFGNGLAVALGNGVEDVFEKGEVVDFVGGTVVFRNGLAVVLGNGVDDVFENGGVAVVLGATAGVGFEVDGTS
jgi:hypothetical protein